MAPFSTSPVTSSQPHKPTGLTGSLAVPNGIALPQDLFDHSGRLGAALHGRGVIGAQAWGIRDFVQLAVWISVLMFIALACPNTLEIMSRYEPALGVKPLPTQRGIVEVLQCNASLSWAIMVSGIE